SLGAEFFRILKQRIVGHHIVNVRIDPRVLRDDLAPNLDISDGDSLYISLQDISESLQLQNAGAREWHLRLIGHDWKAILADDSVHFLSQFLLNLGVLGEEQHGPSQR
ncbi:hypothetical protein PENTCL1PPCAC_15157, partial [Pristionchus entomophagus]